VFTEHKKETGDDLLNCEATLTTIRLSRPISTSGLFSQKEKKVVTLNGTSWTMIVRKTQKKRTEVGLSNGEVTVVGWRHLPPISACGPFSQPEGANNSKTMRS
jgi:hypothetical protein